MVRLPQLCGMCALCFIVLLKSCVSCQALAQAMEQNLTLTYLCLYYKNVGDEGAKAWCLVRMVSWGERRSEEIQKGRIKTCRTSIDCSNSKIKTQLESIFLWQESGEQSQNLQHKQQISSPVYHWNWQCSAALNLSCRCPRGWCCDAKMVLKVEEWDCDLKKINRFSIWNRVSGFANDKLAKINNPQKRRKWIQ